MNDTYTYEFVLDASGEYFSILKRCNGYWVGQTTWLPNSEAYNPFTHTLQTAEELWYDFSYLKPDCQ